MRLIGVTLFAAGAFATCPWEKAHPEEPCGEALLGFSLSNVDSATPFDGILGAPSGEGKAVIGAEEGKKTKARAFASIVTRIDEGYRRSVQGWTFSLVVEGDAVPLSASFQRSAGAVYSRGGFQVVHIAEPGANEGRRGFVSAVVLGGHIDAQLPDTGTIAVLEFEIEEAIAHGMSDRTAVIRFRDGLQVPPALRPVSNGIMLRGVTTAPCNKGSASLTLIFSLDGPRFLRGDSNGDGELQLSDAVFLLSGLFEEQRPEACPAASDANADLHLDISDAIYVLTYLFQGGSSPAAPFPDCGPDPGAEQTPLSCLEPQPGCG